MKSATERLIFDIDTFAVDDGPGITDTDENLRGIFGFMREAGLRCAAVLPYNASASAKYEWLGAAYEIDGEIQTPTRLAEIVNMAREAGIDAVVG